MSLLVDRHIDLGGALKDPDVLEIITHPVVANAVRACCHQVMTAGSVDEKIVVVACGYRGGSIHDVEVQEGFRQKCLDACRHNDFVLGVRKRAPLMLARLLVAYFFFDRETGIFKSADVWIAPPTFWDALLNPETRLGL